MPNGSDHNAGYECDRNHGIGRTNPAHTGCTTTTTTTTTPPPSETGGCPTVSSALTQAAVVALEAASVVHPELTKVSAMAEKKAEADCGQTPGKHSDNGTGHTPITICHATGSATNPFVEITIDENGLHGHDGHDGDIIPAPAGGCPQVTQQSAGNTPTQQQPTTVSAPADTVAPTTESGTAPATEQTPAQEVLGERVHGSAPSKGRQEVLGQRTSGSTPASASVPAAAQRPVQAGDQGGSLPFTGTDALLVLFLGCLMLLAGVGLQRMLARN
jgi:hypothetical protein